MTTYYKGKIGLGDVGFGNDTFLRRNALGANESFDEINLGDIPRKTSIAKTSDYTIVSKAGEYIFTNEGASGTVTISLPVAKVGMSFSFIILEDTQELRVDPNGTQYFRDCAAGKYKYSDVAGNRLFVWCDIIGIWEYDYDLVSGNWDNET